jgi:muramoyltetrapeptide carboxypeptidase
MINFSPVRPKRLRADDLVALVAPAGATRQRQADSAAAILAGWGLRVRLGRHALGRHTYLAGTDEERLADLNDALRDPEIRGVICLRGGYGSQRIVDDVDYAAARADPKVVMGFSDITALHVALWCEAGLATVHGPTGANLNASPDSMTTATAHRAVMTADPVTVSADHTESTFGVRVAGRAEGTLLGGNVTMLAATAGTRHKLDLTGAILLIEAMSEETYRLDRVLVQLKRSGWFDGLAGVALGQFTDCEEEDPGPTVPEILLDHFGELGIPVLGGLPVGHGDQQTAVALGVPAVLDAGTGTLTVQPIDPDPISASKNVAPGV